MLGFSINWLEYTLVHQRQFSTLTNLVEKFLCDTILTNLLFVSQISLTICRSKEILTCFLSIRWHIYHLSYFLSCLPDEFCRTGGILEMLKSVMNVLLYLTLFLTRKLRDSSIRPVYTHLYCFCDFSSNILNIANHM